MSMKEKLAIKVAFALPRNVAMWAAIRVGAHATQGPFSKQVVPDLLFMDALKRWDAPATPPQSPAAGMSLKQRIAQLFEVHIFRSGLALAGLAPIVDKLDAVPEGQRGWYVEKDGKFNLDPTKIEIEDTTGLKSALEKERLAVKDRDKKLREQAELYKDVDPAKYREIMGRLDGDEEGKLIAAGKLDEVWTRRSEKMRIENNKLLEAEQAKTKAEQEKTGSYKARVLENHIRSGAAAVKGGIHAAATEDVILRARSVFTLDDSGEAVMLDKDGAVVFGKDGKTPFSPAEWIEGMKEKAPHWFPSGNSGGGGGGNNGGKGGADLSHLKPADRMAAHREAQGKK